jgi:NTE family protein
VGKAEAAPSSAEARVESRKRVAVVIGAGSVKCAAALGLTRVLAREGIAIDLLVGCSAGSIFTALTAVGHRSEIAATMAEQLWTHDLTAARNNRALLAALLPRIFGFDEHFGLRRDTRVMDRLRAAFGMTRIEELKIPLRVTATDFHSGEQVVFDEGSLIDAIRASISIPFIFKPWDIDGRLCVDGLVSDPLPVGVAISEGADIVLAMGFESPRQEEVRNPVRFAFQLSSIMTNNLMRSRYALHHLARYSEVIPVIPQFKEHIHLFDAGKIPFIIEQGERATEAILPRLREMLAASATAPGGTD